jgi:hypothetical protein
LSAISTFYTASANPSGGRRAARQFFADRRRAGYKSSNPVYTSVTLPEKSLGMDKAAYRIREVMI